MPGTLHLAQTQSNRGLQARKKDLPDAERLVKWLMANELTLRFVPDAEQRLWRTVMRRKYQLTRNRVQLQNSAIRRAVRIGAMQGIWRNSFAALCFRLSAKNSGRRIRRKACIPSSC